MTPSDPVPEARRPSLIDREVRRIATARSVTFGLALTFFALALVGGIVMRLTEQSKALTVMEKRLANIESKLRQ
jgi:hypothetical protein